MKKLFLLTLSCLFGFVLGASAQDETEYTRKTWDFTKGWSDETKADLNADTKQWAANRTDANTGEVTGWKDATKLSGILTANGNVIKELDGISFGTAGLSGSNNMLLDATTIRISRTGMEFTLKTKVKAGQTITMEYKSANGTATDRGFKCITPGVNLTQGAEIALGTDGWEGNPRIWTVDASVTEPIEVTFKAQPSGGLDIRLIMIDNGDEPEVEDAAQVAFLYRSTHSGYSLDEDFAYIGLTSAGSLETTAIDVATAELTRDELMAYDAIVLSQTVEGASTETDESALSVIRGLRAFTPIVQIGAASYRGQGFGEFVQSEETTILVPENLREDALWADIPMEDGVIDFGVPVDGVKLAADGYFGDDQILATVGEAAAIHIHNAKRNAYILIPEAVTKSEVALTLLPNAIAVIKATKKAEGTTATPSIVIENKDGEAVATIKGTGTVYYTTDGTDPTTASAVYTESLTFTEAATLKAIAVADGYLPSKVASADVVIMSQTATPSVSVAQNGEKATVTLSGEGTIYFNFSGQTTVSASAVYTEPFDVDRHVTVTAFVVEEEKLQSEAVIADVVVEGYKYNNELAHFDANKDTYYTPYTEIYSEGLSANKAMYYFGKSSQTCYTDEVVGTKEVEVKDEEGNVTGTETVNVYAVKEPTVIDFESGWAIGSSGQVVTWTSDAPSNAAVGDESNRYPGTVFDWGATITPNITFGGCASGEENTAFIQTTAKYQAPLEVVAYVGNGHSSSQPSAEIQVSADGKNWTKVADCNIWPVRRCYMRTAAVYDGTDEVYVRLRSTGKTSSAMVYDIYLNGLGQYDGIETVSVPNNSVAANTRYNLAGQKVGAGYKGIVIMGGKKMFLR